MPSMYSDSTIPTSRFTATSELLALSPDTTIASGEAFPAPVRAMPESERDWLIQNQVCGGKCSELSSKPDPALLLSKIQKACSSGEVEKSLPLSEWQDIVSKTRSSYRQRKLALGTKETESLSSVSFRTLHSSRGTTSNPPGLTKCEQSLRKLGIISPSHYLSTRGMELIFGFPLGWTDCLATRPSLSPTLESKAEPKVESEPDTPLQKQSCPDKLTLPSNDCSTLPKPSESSIKNITEFALSGLRISFGKTLPYLFHKTVTRRCWKDSHAKKFANAFHQNKLIKALDKDIRYGGKQIGWCRLLCAPYKEQLAAMPDEDLQAEGGMCSSVTEFVKRYFKGDSSLEVWVIRFELVASDRVASTKTPEPFGVYSDSETKADSNSAITLSSGSIHHPQLFGYSSCWAFGSTTNSNSPLTLAPDSIHQASLTLLGVYSVIPNKVNSSFSITLRGESIHQASPAPHPSYKNNPVPFPNAITTDSIEAASVSVSQEHQRVSGVYDKCENQINTNTDLSSLADSIHQSSIPSLGVYPNEGNPSDSNTTNDLLAASIHQAPVVQGGSGLVYSFWKGESIVNHYRYKVKVNGKWQVKSIYIPVGKLPKVKEAIANKLSVAAIVEILGRNL
jgi:hypothetical protein